MRVSADQAADYSFHLSAPEVEVLFHGSKIGDRAALKLGLRELVMRGALTLVHVEKRGIFGITRRMPVLVPGPNYAARFCDPLQVVIDMHRSAWTPGDLLNREGFARAVRDRDDLGMRPMATRNGDGLVGTPVSELSRVVFHRYRHNGWITIGFRNLTHGYVRAKVLTQLYHRGLGTWDGMEPGAACFQEAVRRLREDASILSPTGGESVIDSLRAQAPHLDIPTIFAAIDSGVDRGWYAEYDDGD